ncbi:hypothetical protein KAU11_06835, partial [Candidatus Babeliales bacterium]|nr:hypothetical protein [Candidatus Babeliales bacterium]
GGSGGSIYITAGTIYGNGTINANGGQGGDGYYCDGGGGAGGRIAIYSTTDTSAITKSASGGWSAQYGGAGTIYTKSTAQSYGELLIDNNNHAGAITPLNNSYGITTLDNLTIRNKSNVYLKPGQNLTVTVFPPIQTAYLTLQAGSALNISTLNLQSSSTLTLQSGSDLLNIDNITLSSSTLISSIDLNLTNLTMPSSTVTNNGNLSWKNISFPAGTINNNGLITADSLNVTNVTFNDDGNFSIADNIITIDNAGIVNVKDSNFDIPALNIKSGGILTHQANSNTQVYVLNIIASNITIESGGLINATAKGYLGAYRTGSSQHQGYGSGRGYGHDNGGGGAGYGGNGGSGAGAAGTAYGSVTQPTDLGSGGGGGRYESGGYGGNGGGAIFINVSDTLTVDGSIIADGEKAPSSGRAGGGGSGGSIWIDTNILAGSGTIAADGGAGWHGYDDSGGGAGGRIAIYSTITGTSAITKSAGGAWGAQYGGAGTIYTKAASQTYGELLIDNSNHAGAITPLNNSYDITALDNLTIRNKSNVYLKPSQNLTVLTFSPMQIAYLTLQAGSTLNTSSIELQSLSTLTLQSGSDILNIDKITLSSSTLTSSIDLNLTNLTIPSSTVTNNGNLSWKNISFPAGTINNNGLITVDSLNITEVTFNDNGDLSIADNKITIDNAGTFNVQDGLLDIHVLNIKAGG